MARNRSPGIKLLFTVLIGVALTIPLIFVYALVSDRQNQSNIAQAAITGGWGSHQVVSGPIVVIPYLDERVQTETVGGRSVTRTVTIRDYLYLAPLRQRIGTTLNPEVKTRSIYRAVIYNAQLEGEAVFAIPPDLDRHGVEESQLIMDEAELRFGASDPRGLQADARVSVGGESIALQPGNGVAASGGSGFHGFLDWTGKDELAIEWAFTLRGSHALSLVPRGGETAWDVRSPWPHPSFAGSFLPEPSATEVESDGFRARWSVTNLALGQSLLLKADPGPPVISEAGYEGPILHSPRTRDASESMVATIRLIEPVDLYSRVDRAVKYGFLFIGFTFLAYLMFDIVAGARVAAAEYLLTGVGLVLFFVLLLAFAEVIGFAASYILASAAIIALLTAYSAAVLGSWRRAWIIGGMLVGLYALLYVLLSLEAWSLLIGSVLLFAALAAVMYVTRRIDWSGGARDEEAANAPA